MADEGTIEVARPEKTRQGLKRRQGQRLLSGDLVARPEKTRQGLKQDQAPDE